MSEFDRTLDLLRGLNRQLDEYERTRDQSMLSGLQVSVLVLSLPLSLPLSLSFFLSFFLSLISFFFLFFFL